MPTPTPQSFEQKRDAIHADFAALRAANPAALAEPLTLAWSTWVFGIEPLQTSLRRLVNNGILHVELAGNRHGADIGDDGAATRRLLKEHGVACCGICGLYSPQEDLASNSGIVRQQAIDYIRRNLDFAHAVGATYFLIVPSAVGRTARIDDSEFHRSVETLQRVAPLFEQAEVKGAIEPIRKAEVALVHTVAQAQAYIAAVGSPGIRHINADVYHMQTEELYTPQAVRECGAQLINLHLADTHRGALGEASLDLDTILMALYLNGHNTAGRFCTAEPLGTGADPYAALFGKADGEELDRVVKRTAETFREREAALRA